jgi:hypothetical protein
MVSALLEHDPQKRKPFLRKDHAQRLEQGQNRAISSPSNSLNPAAGLSFRGGACYTSPLPPGTANKGFFHADRQPRCRPARRN